MTMTKYREILRLKSLGLSQQSIADSCNVSKKTVNRVLERAKELGISWPLDESNTDAILAEKFFPSANQVKSNKRIPDYAYIHKELLRNGVSNSIFAISASNAYLLRISANTLGLAPLSYLNPNACLIISGKYKLSPSLVRYPACFINFSSCALSKFSS